MEKREGYDAQHFSFIELIEKPGDEVHLLIGDEVTQYWDVESETIGKVQAELAKEAAKK